MARGEREETGDAKMKCAHEVMSRLTTVWWFSKERYTRFHLSYIITGGSSITYLPFIVSMQGAFVI